MALNLVVGARSLTQVALAVALALIANIALAQSIKGTATYRERMATRLTIVGDRLELFDAAGKRLAVFAAGAQASPPSTTPGLEGTSWQLVKFQGSDDTTLTPDDRSKYTIELGAGGQLTARIDCNRGRGTWKSSGPNQLQFGPLALTRAQCPPGSLHDHIVKQWSFIRSYVMKDGHLFLSLMADGGIYEFEPIKKTKP
ncbi:MAG: META domain-containing protein [Vicinamibacterales bacterium]